MFDLIYIYISKDFKLVCIEKVFFYNLNAYRTDVNVAQYQTAKS